MNYITLVLMDSRVQSNIKGGSRDQMMGSKSCDYYIQDISLSPADEKGKKGRNEIKNESTLDPR